MSKSAAKKSEPLGLVDINRRYRIPDAAELLGVSLFSIYRDMRNGDLKVIREGARTFIPGSEIARRSQLPA